MDAAVVLGAVDLPEAVGSWGPLLQVGGEEGRG